MKSLSHPDDAELSKRIERKLLIAGGIGLVLACFTLVALLAVLKYQERKAFERLQEKWGEHAAAIWNSGK